MTTGNNDYTFTMDDEGPATRLVVLGVGGMGNNAMENLARSAVPGLELFSLNTDVQALRRCHGSRPVQLGAKRTGGKGAGGNSDIGRMSAEDDSEKIRRIVAGAELVFIASGMGGGTGSGAAPVIAKICRDLGVLSVCVVTLPMQCEGLRREEKGRTGLAELRKTVDSLLIIENEKLSTVMDQEDVSIIEVFRKADKVVVDIVAAIAGIINSHGYINLDLADLKNVLQRGKDACVDAYIGIGEATGPDRARKATEIALNNQLLSTINIEGAANLLVNVVGSDQIGHNEAMIAVNTVVESAGIDNQEIFMGVVTDNAMGDRIRVTVIATELPSRNTTVVKIKSPVSSGKKVFTGQYRDEAMPNDIPVDFRAACERAKVITECATGHETTESVDYFPDVTGVSPLVRKDEWQSPAYLRAKNKTTELDARMPETTQVRRILTRSKTSDFESVKATLEPQLRQPLYHMVG